MYRNRKKPKIVKQTNYINNHDCLVNIERIDDAFWTGLIIGSLVGVFATLHLMRNRLVKNNLNK